ncbi:SAV_915 family protein [Streptomyces sp. NBC_01431]|uniref:SAV_915 family protein n=1 Tax=Streptomyces sp. NBC_01431 TaxID=2903863 RepID=UPI002E3128D8|nr:SAV_915 family protein [Streptomyces sp. NBC_01431]
MLSLTIEDADPEERRPAGPLYVPVRLGSAGGHQLRFLRDELGVRTAVGFTSPDRLNAVLGGDQAWIRLAEPALKALSAPLGVTRVTVDPLLSPPAAQRRRGQTASAPASACARRDHALSL